MKRATLEQCNKQIQHIKQKRRSNHGTRPNNHLQKTNNKQTQAQQRHPTHKKKTKKKTAHEHIQRNKTCSNKHSKDKTTNNKNQTNKQHAATTQTLYLEKNAQQQHTQNIQTKQTHATQ